MIKRRKGGKNLGVGGKKERTSQCSLSGGWAKYDNPVYAFS